TTSLKNMLVFPRNSHFLRVPWDFQKLLACPCAAPAALHCASRNPNRVAFRVAQSRCNTGVLHVPVWYLHMSVEAVGFERDA
ncbi:MAG: hypothetical protein ACKO9Q_09095, partial [Pirellula sp.]